MPPTSGSPSIRTLPSARPSRVQPRPSRAPSPTCTCRRSSAGAPPPSALRACWRAVCTDDPCETAGLPACGLLRRRLVPILAQIPDDAAGTGRLTCGADVAPMQDQPVVGILAELGRRIGDERVLDFSRRLSRREPGAIGDTENVCVD